MKWIDSTKQKIKTNISTLTLILIFFGLNLYVLVQSVYFKNYILLVFLVIELLLIIILYRILYILRFRNVSEEKIKVLYERNWGKDSLMVIVPHPDDEINIAGVLIRNYLLLRKKVYIVFSTNFDAYGIREAKQRYKELNNLYRKIGVSKDDIFFLGFPSRTYIVDETKKCYKINGTQCIYNMYSNNNTTIYENIVKDTKEQLADRITALVNLLRPDVIVCVDEDSNLDHKYLSAAFEESICEIESIDKGYKPVILKGFSYAPAWMGVRDYYKVLTIGMSVLNENNSSNTKKYNWEDRIRIPYINNIDLGYSLRSTFFYKLLAFYSSQNALSHANQLLNSDEVFWCLSNNVEKINLIKFCTYEEKNYLYQINMDYHSIIKVSLIDISGNYCDLTNYSFFYHTLNNEKKSELRIDNPLYITLNFDKSGQYIVSCYDNTSSCIDTITIIVGSMDMCFFRWIRKYEVVVDWFLIRIRNWFYAKKRKQQK